MLKEQLVMMLEPTNGLSVSIEGGCQLTTRVLETFDRNHDRKCDKNARGYPGRQKVKDS
jgi:hypothetical protein